MVFVSTVHFVLESLGMVPHFFGNVIPTVVSEVLPLQPVREETLSLVFRAGLEVSTSFCLRAIHFSFGMPEFSPFCKKICVDPGKKSKKGSKKTLLVKGNVD